MIASAHLTGLILDERYKLLECVHASRFASVYHARRLSDAAAVAVKIISAAQWGRTHEAVARFERGVKALALIRHPNVLPIDDAGETTEGLLYFSTPWLKGKTLGETLYAEGQLSLRRILHLFPQLCAAVQAIHDAGVIHRDLKPSNIFLHREPTDDAAHERVLLLDFGIAKPTVSLSDADDVAISGVGVVIGTPEYMSPEQCSDGEVAAASDVYSLGVVLYAMLAGAPPFDGNVSVVMLRHLNNEPPSLRIRRPKIAAPLEAVVMRALAKSPDQRPASAAALARAVTEIVDDSMLAEDVRYREASPPETNPAAIRLHTRAVQAVTPDTPLEPAVRRDGPVQ
jgi:eukaryotic-like serine/threonine-protein kinase